MPVKSVIPISVVCNTDCCEAVCSFFAGCCGYLLRLFPCFVLFVFLLLSLIGPVWHCDYLGGESLAG